MCHLRAAQKIVLPPDQQNTVPLCTNTEIGTTTGTAEVTPTIIRKKALLVIPAIIKLEKEYMQLQITNPHDHTYTINTGAILVNFLFLTQNQEKYIKLIAPEHLNLLTQHAADATAVINQLFQDEPTTTTQKRYPKPETCHDPQTLNTLERRIYDAIVNLRQQEKLDPKTSDGQRYTFPSRFN